MTESNKRARLCNEQYPKIRDRLLESHPWNFAIKRQDLSVSTEEPVFGYTYKYALPTDCLRVLSVNDDGDAEYKVETSTFLFTDEADVSIRFIQKVTDTTLYSKMFAETLAVQLAADIGYAITQNATLVAELIDLGNKLEAKAKSYDAQEGSMDHFEAPDFIKVRF